MNKPCENSSQTEMHGNEYECSKCEDKGFVLKKYPVFGEDGEQLRWPNKTLRFEEVAEECECLEQSRIRTRFRNALIPNEFKNARFDNFIRKSQVQIAMYETMTSYLKRFGEMIISDSPTNSLGFIAVFGEQRLKQLPSSERLMAKKQHNNFGLGKTHLQIAAAKWLMKNEKIVEKINEFGKEKTIERGCRVLCVSDVSFMEDLTSSKMAGDGGEEFQRLISTASKWADVLIWDDIGKSKWTESREGMYYQIINERYRNNKPIIFSSNEDKGTLSEKIGYAASSRLFSMAGQYLLEVEGEDQRLKRKEQPHVQAL